MKELPNSIDSEKNLLAAMMLNGGEIVPEVAAQLTANDFYRPEHREIFKAIIAAYNSTTEPLSDTMIIDVLERTKARVDRAYVTSIMACEFTTARAATYIKNIKETARLRRLIDISAIVTSEAFDGTKSAAEVTAQLEKLLLEDDEPAPTNLESAGKIAIDVYNHVSQIKQGELTGVTTGFYDLNRITNGLQKSDLIFLAARPSMGKTALALNIALNAAKQKKSVAVFSLEMSKYQIGTRLLSSMTDIAVTAITSGTADHGQLIDAVECLHDLPLYIDDTSSLTVSAIRAKAKKFKREHGLDLIIIDYVQLMVGDRDNPNRVQEVSDISRKLKGLAKSFNVPVLALSQLNRGVEIRADKRPQLSDLRESGSLEQDADIVMFLYRDDYYNREECETPNVAELIIAKNRNGATGTIRLHFETKTVLFTDLTRTED